MEDKGYFNKVCLSRFTWSRHFVSGDRVLSSLGTGRVPFSLEIYVLLLGNQGEDRKLFLNLLFLSSLQLKIINIPKWHILR